MLIPLTTDGEAIVSMQTIDADGKKRFLAGGQMKACYYAIGEIDDEVVIGEGYATCASIYEATGLPVVIAFNAGNIEAVAKSIREQLPMARIIIAADDDYGTERERGFNPGLRAAKSAAKAVGGLVVVPPFDRASGAEGTDWNDFAAQHGKVRLHKAFKEQLDDAEIARLAALDGLAYDRERKDAADALGVRASTLDGLVVRKREELSAQEAESLCADVEPCSEPIDVPELLDQVRSTLLRFIVCEPTTATAAALWICFTWIIEHVQVAPIAIITAPEKRCGKTQLLDLIGRLSRRALFASNISPAATFRIIEAKSPTLLIDEADAFFRMNEELRGVINSGRHTRPTAFVIRTVGDDHEVKQFSTWGAKAIAGIGRLQETVMDRAIVFSLRRKLPDERVERLRDAEPNLFDMLARKLARFGADNGAALGRMRPNSPEALNDRAQDNWEPLLAIADLAGGDWPEEARAAALAISGDGQDDPSAKEELLGDIREVFENGGADRSSITDLLDALCGKETAPWALGATEGP